MYLHQFSYTTDEQLLVDVKLTVLFTCITSNIRIYVTVTMSANVTEHMHIHETTDVTLAHT